MAIASYSLPISRQLEWTNNMDTPSTPASQPAKRGGEALDPSPAKRQREAAARVGQEADEEGAQLPVVGLP